MRKLNSFALTLAATVLVLVGCDSNEYKKTESGLEYKFEEKGNGPAPKEGEFMVMNMEYTLEETDSVMFSSLEQPTPLILRYADSAWSVEAQKGTVWEMIHMLKQGDSIVFRINAENLYKKSFGQSLPPEIKAEQMVQFHVGVDSVMDETGYRKFEEAMFKKEMERMRVEAEKQQEKDIEKIESYLKENNVEAQKTESGLYYVINEEGKGQQAAAGDKVKVHYTGKTMDGTKFDSSHDRDKPIEFVLGRGQVIRGWDEGIALLKEGDKATFYIPSTMAYGPRGAGGVIGPNEVLVFDVELLEIVE